jgi:hypothetical protein
MEEDREKEKPKESSEYTLNNEVVKLHYTAMPLIGRMIQNDQTLSSVALTRKVVKHDGLQCFFTLFRDNTSIKSLAIQPRRTLDEDELEQVLASLKKNKSLRELIISSRIFCHLTVLDPLFSFGLHGLTKLFKTIAKTNCESLEFFESNLTPIIAEDSELSKLFNNTKSLHNAFEPIAKALSSCSNLHTLTLNIQEMEEYQKIHTFFAEIFKNLKNSNIRKISVQSTGPKLDHNFLELLDRFPLLQEFSINGTRTSPDEEFSVKKLKTLNQDILIKLGDKIHLKTLQIDGRILFQKPKSDDPLEFVLSLKEIVPRLTCLVLSQTKLDYYCPDQFDELLDIIFSNTNFISLTFGDVKFSQKQMKRLTDYVKKSKTLKILKLSGGAPGIIGLTSLIKSLSSNGQIEELAVNPGDYLFPNLKQDYCKKVAKLLVDLYK